MKALSDKIRKSRNMYIWGMTLMMIAGYVLLTCGSMLFRLTDNFPYVSLGIASVLLLIYNVAAVLLYLRLVCTQQTALVRFYLANKVIRMLFSFVIVLGFGLLAPVGVVAFMVCFFILYIITLIYESVFFVQIEKKINEEPDK